MNSNTRTQNAIINFGVNIIYQFLIILISFITRRIFIETLGMEYLGISGLFSNLLEILALAELGIGSAMSFSMYKNIAKKDYRKLQALNSYYKILYNRIALIVLIIGLAFLPFLKYIINVESDINNIEIYYLISLLNSVFSYLFVYKTTIVNADQSGYKLKIINIVFEFLKAFLQIISLVIFKNYILFLLVQIISTLVSNFVKSSITGNLYPFIKEKAELEVEEKKNIWTNIKSMFYYKVGGVLMDSTDNILISMLINTTTVGIYSNYIMIFNKIGAIIALFFDSIMASIGNLNATTSKNKQYSMHKLLDLMASIFYTIASVGIYHLMEDVITAISGTDEFLLDKSILILSVISFYITGIIRPNYMYRNTSGLFKLGKNAMLVCSILNIVLSIIFGNMFGLFGIILATIMSRLFTNVWYEPFLLYKYFFDKSPKHYYINQIYKIILCILMTLILIPVMNLIIIENLYVRIFIKFIICMVFCSVILFLIYRKNQEFKYLVTKIYEILKSIQNKFKKKKI